MDLSQARHAFVTGGASGIGLAIAKALADRGIAVTIADVNAETLKAATADGRLRGQLVDVRDRAGLARAKAECEAALGPVDILVNNAGIPGRSDHLADIDPADFEEVIATNLIGVFNGISTFGADMRARGRGHIVNTSSMQGMAVESPGVGPYGTAKAGVVAISEVLRLEMAPHGVGVSAYCPGMTLTPMVINALRGHEGAQGELPSSLSVVPMPPEQAAQIVLKGIEENRPYILTHPARRPQVERRYAAIMACFEPD
jgi:NAD(P)-dependent dehydrogenase (short-subunit alcohol dehydrogenase family)